MNARATLFSFALALAVMGCRLDDVVDHAPTVSHCSSVLDMSPCYNGDEIARDRGAGVEYREGICVAKQCVTPAGGTDISGARTTGGRIRFYIEIFISIALPSFLLLFGRAIARFVARRKNKKLAYDAASVAPPPPPAPPSRGRRVGTKIAIAVVALAPAILLLHRYPARALASSRTPRSPEGAGWVSKNTCNPTEVFEGGGKTWIIANVFKSDEALGTLGFLAAYDVETGASHVLVGPARQDDQILPIRFVAVKDKLVTLDDNHFVTIYDASFHVTGKVEVAMSQGNIQRAPGGKPEAWVGPNTYFGYIDVDRGAVLEHPADYWAHSLECWKRDYELCHIDQWTPDGTESGRESRFADGCIVRGIRKDNDKRVLVERRTLTTPSVATWQIEHELASPSDRDVTVIDKYLYGSERENGGVAVVQRSLADGAKRWSIPMPWRVALEPPFAAGKWLVIPIYPVKDEYGERYLIVDPETGKVARTLP